MNANYKEFIDMYMLKNDEGFYVRNKDMWNETINSDGSSSFTLKVVKND